MSIITWTALIGAAAEGHVEVMRYLVEQGEDKDKAGVIER